MAGKYAHIVKTLPKFLGPDPSYNDKVNAVKGKIISDNPLESRDPAWLAAQYARLREQKDQLESMMSEINLEIESFSQLIVDAYENAGITSQRLAEGPSVSVQLEPYAQLVDRDINREWAINNGLERNLLLPWQTLNAVTKDRLLNGEEPPPGVKAFSKPKLVLRK